MAFVQLSNISLSFGDRDLIKSATLNLMEGSRAALAGPNGAGKTTLMKIAVGQLAPDSGELAVTKGARISYLPQTQVILGRGSVLEEAEAAFSHFADMLLRQEELGRRLQDSGLEERQTNRLLEEFDDIGRAVESGGYFRRQERISEVLRGLGFRTDDFGRRAQDLSGGWQMRLALAKILLEDPDIMLLDEPTNYLDLEARGWLEAYLADYRGGVLLVSHDRFFLDVTVREVYELFNGKLSRYPGSYSSYEERRARELEAIFAAWERQQEEIQRIEDFIRRFRYKESKAPQVQSRIKMLEKIIPIEIPEGMKHIHFKFPPAPRSGKIALRIENLGKSYGSLKVIEDLSLEVERGRKIAFVGPNGAGKSTLMRIIAGVDRDYTGSIIPGAGVEIAYFAQDSAEKMSSSLNVEQEAETVCPNELAPKLRNLLGAFLFRGDDVGKSVSVLSGGERSRLALLKMLLHPANLLVLDEPTNHLDLTSKDVLLEALKTFEGTVLFVSHDRGFIDELADLVLELEVGTTPRLYYGGYSYYLEKKASLLEEARIGSSSIPPRAASRGEATIQAGENPAFRSEDGSKAGTALSWEEEKAQKARTRKLKKREEEILRRLENLAEGKKALEREMARPEVYSDGPRVKKILAALAEIEEETESLNEEWVETAEALSVK
ncbi:MAG: ABC-F family ATP-binding cassette domain-containing protein [Spirochaetia bacterium]|jgi:ATP-binding cassette subfamily F protein 3|nr:ABC-F family ATP-binding cassette domain-containing protein [Spirochaetia bacterium]MCE1209198.1 ABC-F family ATP-binding cassette domain-containing protein [Spirochaetia bacterium]HOI23199.1 ABC-F family ATP-binding cassette domain-containing protein [Spirochaetales bacterium]